MAIRMTLWSNSGWPTSRQNRRGQFPITPFTRPRPRTGLLFFCDRGRMGLSFGRNIVARLCSVDKDD